MISFYSIVYLLTCCALNGFKTGAMVGYYSSTPTHMEGTFQYDYDGDDDDDYDYDCVDDYYVMW